MTDTELPPAVALCAAVVAALVVTGTLYASRSVALTVAAFVCCALGAAVLGRVANDRGAN